MARQRRIIADDDSDEEPGTTLLPPPAPVAPAAPPPQHYVPDSVPMADTSEALLVEKLRQVLLTAAPVYILSLDELGGFSFATAVGRSWSPQDAAMGTQLRNYVDSGGGLRAWSMRASSQAIFEPMADQAKRPDGTYPPGTDFGLRLLDPTFGGVLGTSPLSAPVPAPPLALALAPAPSPAPAPAPQRSSVPRAGTAMR